jgi:2-polyprenyl-6-methoxyphenol hydroxylase-like FAD-dependent oxidoreductase
MEPAFVDWVVLPKPRFGFRRTLGIRGRTSAATVAQEDLMYDAIVVGGRCAGAPTAMLLARKGHKVLLVDKAAFPSDTLSTHLLWPHGAEMLARWGLLDRLAASGVPPICVRMSFDVGPFALRGAILGANGGRGGFCPRRTVLDALLVNAAAESGAEIRENYLVEELAFDGDAVVGIRGRTEGGRPVEERARFVVGADGVRSLVARAVRAPEYDCRPVLACAYYSYFSGVVQDDVALHIREHRAFGAAPTNDGLHLVMVNWPAREFQQVKADVEGQVWHALDLAPEFAARIGAGRREEKWYGTGGLPNYFRRPYGEGWALVGDAGYNRDPVTAQGMSDAFVDADRLAGALHAALSGEGRFDELMAAYESGRNARVRPMYDFTCEFAALEPPPPPMQALFGALRGNQEATNAFLSAISGAIPLPRFMAHENIERIMATARDVGQAG